MTAQGVIGRQKALTAKVSQTSAVASGQISSVNGTVKAAVNQRRALVGKAIQTSYVSGVARIVASSAGGSSYEVVTLTPETVTAGFGVTASTLNLETVTASRVLLTAAGSPPLTFTSNGSPLEDYVIFGAEGGVGNLSSANLFVGVSLEAGSIYSDSGAPYDRSARLRSDDFIALSAGTYHINATKSIYAADLNLMCVGFKYDANGDYIGSTGDWSSLPVDFTFNSACKFKIVFAYSNYITEIHPEQISSVSVQDLSSGATIPITCGGVTTVITVGEPLYAGDSISMTDTSVQIPTVSGSNTLTVGTEIQPASVTISYRMA